MRLFFSLSVSLLLTPASLSLSLYFYLSVCYCEFTSLWVGKCLFDTCWCTHTRASVHIEAYTQVYLCAYTHTYSHLQCLLDTSSQSAYMVQMRFSAEIKMRCWQASVEITRPTNLWPALWNQWHQLLLEPNITGVRCNISKWHSRAKSSLP